MSNPASSLPEEAESQANESDRTRRNFETEESVLTSYHKDRYFERECWADAKRFISGNGICVGVGGSRGSGKSWLLRRAQDWADDVGGIGVYFPSPSAYSAPEFLSALCLALATRITEAFPRPRSIFDLARSRAVQRWTPLATIAVGVLLVFYLHSFAHRSWNESIVWPVIGLIAVIFLGFYAVFMTRVLSHGRRPYVDIYDSALAMQQWIQFASSRTNTSQMSLTAGKGLSIAGTSSQALALVERPVSELALITEFRKLAEQVVALDKRLVICIDELDKIGTVEEVRDLLRGVKGVLDPQGVNVLISISDEAVEHFGLGGVRGSDEIRSSLNAVVTVPSLELREAPAFVNNALDRTQIRTVSGVFSSTLCILTGGNEREMVRQLDVMLRRSLLKREEAARLVVGLADQEERNEFLGALLIESTISDDERVSAFNTLMLGLDIANVRYDGPSDFFFREREAYDLFSEAERETTSNSDSSVAANRKVFVEAWKRVIVRIFIRSAIYQELTSADEKSVETIERMELFQRAIVWSQRSAEIARRVLLNPELKARAE
jgi:hypothetical protein